MISLSIVGGKPKVLMSFLKPILEEIHQLSNEGLQVRKKDKIVYSGFVHLLGCTGDVPALAELMGHDGHMSKYGCKTCLVKGRRCSDTGTGMYFCYKGADRTIEDLKLGDSTTNLKGVHPLFQTLKTFTSMDFFMYLFFGISKMIYSMLGLSSSTTEFRPTAPPSAPEELSSEGNTTAPRSTCTPFSAGPYPFRMRAAGLSTTMRRRKTGKLLNLSRPHIPLIFDACSTIILNQLVNEEAKHALMALIRGCAIIALQWQVSKDDLIEMDICFNDWHCYLRECILSNKLSERVFTVNMHALCHLKHLVLCLGRMRAYSCRSMEHTIKFFSNLITGTTNVAANASNVMFYDLHYRRFAINKLQIKHFPLKQFDPKTYRVYPHATEVDMGQLWRPFQMQNIKYVAKTSSSVVYFGIPQYKVAKALVNYYSRTEGEKLPVDWINWGTVELASALEKDGIVYGPVMEDRRLRHLKTRANNAVLFKAVQKMGKRRVNNVWLVATIQCFFIHKQGGGGVTQFLVLGKVMKKNEIDDHHVITVTKFASTDQGQKIAVLSTIEDILECVGLLQHCAEEPTKYKVIWPSFLKTAHSPDL